MGTLERLLSFHRAEVLRVLDVCLERGWTQGNTDFRAGLLNAFGGIRGFDPKPNHSWKRASSGLRFALRQVGAERLKALTYVLAVGGDVERTAEFTRAICGDMPADQPDGGALPVPTREGWITALEKLAPDAHQHFLVFASVTAANDKSPMRQSAAEALEELYSKCFLPSDATTEDDSETSQALAELESPAENLAESDPSRPRQGAQGLTEIDLVFIDMVVQSVDEQHGTRSPGDIGKIIQEFARLNAMRHQSRYLLGFHAAMTGAELPPRSGAENDSRRAWRVAGWLTGHLRRDQNRAYDIFEALPPDDQTALLSQPAAISAIADRFILLLIDAGKPELVARWIPFCSPPIIEACIAFARKLIHQGRAAEALQIRDAVLGTIIEAATLHATRGRMLLQAMLLGSVANRALGRFDKALAACAECDEVCARLAEAPSGSIDFPQSLLDHARAESAAEVILSEARVRDIDSLWFNDDRALKSLTETLAPASERFAEILRQEELPSPAVAYCVALWCFLRLMSGDSAPEHRAVMPWLATLGARPGTGASTSSSPVIPERLWLLKALIQAHDGGATLPSCLSDIAAFEGAAGRLPFQVVRDAIENGLTEDASSVEQVIMPRLATELQLFARSGLLKAVVQSPRIIARLREDLSSVIRELPRNDAVAVVAALFGALAENGGKGPDMRAIGDELVAIVQDYSAGAPDALDAFHLLNRGPSIWGEDDFCAIEFELAMHCTGPYRDAARARLMRRASVLERQMRHDDAEECLDLAMALGEPRESCEGLRLAIDRHRTAEAGTGGAAAADTPSRRVRVLFVGGDERQRREQDNIRRMVAARRRNVELDFEHPGWGSNWGPKLEAAVRKLRNADIVVMLRFTRTIYGEKLRQEISASGKQWRPTYGHGAPAIARAIASAATEFDT